MDQNVNSRRLAGMKVIVFVSSLILVIFSSTATQKTRIDPESPSRFIMASDPIISADGNAQLALQSSRGNGTPGDPYYIENKVIDASGVGSAICINNTDAYFVIQFCIFSNSPSNRAGIWFNNVSNAIIRNSTISNNYVGIKLAYSHYDTILTTTILNNTIGVIIDTYSSHQSILASNFSSNYEGIYNECDYSTIANDTIIGGRWGMILDGRFNLVSNTTVQNTERGIKATSYLDSYNQFLGNNISRNVEGIYLENSKNTLFYNNVSDCATGIHLFEASDNSIMENEVSNNSEYGIALDRSNGNNISKNVLSNNKQSIQCSTASDGNWIFDNNVSNSNYGICSSSSKSNTISDNSVISTDVFNDYGIYLQSSNNVTLSGNHMINCGLYMSGTLSIQYSSHDIDTTNHVNGNPVFYYSSTSNLSGANITNAGQVILANCSNSVLSGVNQLGGSIGILLAFSINATISSNNVTSNGYAGIYAFSSNNTKISGNVVFNTTGAGITIYASSNNMISNNTITNSTLDYAILIRRSTNNMVSGNRVSYSLVGIYMDYSYWNTITNNNATNNDIAFFLNGASNNTITTNNASYNDGGIYLDYDCDDNTLYLNSFLFTDGDCITNHGHNNTLTDNYCGPISHVLDYVISTIAIVIGVLSIIFIVKRKNPFSRKKGRRHPTQEMTRRITASSILLGSLSRLIAGFTF